MSASFLRAQGHLSAEVYSDGGGSWEECNVHGWDQRDEHFLVTWHADGAEDSARRLQAPAREQKGGQTVLGGPRGGDPVGCWKQTDPS